jgi:CheY-like chemotaxis protein
MTETATPVLYVEDEDNDVFLLKLAFRKAGATHPLQIATDGRQAVDYLLGSGPFAVRSEFPLPCLVLLDLNLPQMDGFSVLQFIRADHRLKDLPVVIFTSSEQQSDKDRARKLGATDYVVKPSKVDLLVAFVQAIHQEWLNPDKKDS